MSGIFIGNVTKLFYNNDASNNLVNSPTFVEIDQLADFPQVSIVSSTTSYETYNDEYTGILSAGKSIQAVNIVVHYIPDNSSHQYLDAAFTAGQSRKIQIKVSLYESQDSLDQHYVILNGYVSAFSDYGDQNAVVNRKYVFTAEDVIGRGTAQDQPQLRTGDYGLGSNGLDVPGYESVTPSGSSFIKVPSDQEGNSTGVDMLGIANVDGANTTKLAITESGSLGIYITNGSSGWTQIPLKAQNDSLYVPLTRTINGKALSSNITLTSTDIGSVPVTTKVNGKELSGDITLSSTDTGSVPITRTINGKPLSGDVTLSSTDTGSLALTGGTLTGKVIGTDATFDNLTLTNALPVEQGGTGNSTGNAPTATLAASATKLATPQNVTVNLSSTASASFDGSVAITPGVSGILPVVQGGTGNSTGLAPKATALAVARALITNLGSTTSSSFDGTADSSLGVSGTLPVLNGGTGGTTPDSARLNLVAAKSGANSDITSLTALAGSLRLGGDGQADSDAITLRQLTAATAGGGSSGATLNGVMNNFLGAVEWYNGTRAKLPAGHVAADGQLLNRADYPDIWNAISTGVFLSNTDSAWQSTPTSRGVYSTGDGSTTFRMPDLNGVWVHPTDSTLNSIPALFLRGDGTVANTGTGAGVIRWGAVPNITGAVNINMPGTANFNIATATTGALAPNASATILSSASGLAYSSGNAGIKIDASSSNVAYGRDSSTEVRPNSVKGIWLIRVNGLYSAANTNFNVINGMTAAPATGAVVYGGDSRSALQLNGADYLVARMRSKVVGGGAKTVAFGLADSTGSSVVNTEWTLPATGGELVSKAESGYTSINGKTGGTISSALTVNGLLTTNASINTNGAMTVWSQPASSPNGAFSNAPGLKSRLNTRGAYGDSLGAYGVMYMQEYVGNYHQLIFNLNGFATDYNWFMRAGGQTFSPLGELQYSGSDVRLKSDFTQSSDGALERINKIGSVEFTLNASGRRCRGYVAQQLEDIDPLYTFEGGESIDADGNEFTILNVDQTAIISDLVVTVQQLLTKVADLENQIKTTSTGSDSSTGSTDTSSQ